MTSDAVQNGLGADQTASSSLDQQWDRVRRYGEILADFARVAPEASSVERLSQLACVQAARGIGIGHSKVLRHRPEAGDLLMIAGVGWHPDVVGRTTLGIDLASPSGQTFQTRQVVMVDDAPNDPEFRYSPLLRDHGILSLLNAPIGVDGLVWGVLEVDSATSRYFGADDRWFLAALANVLGLALYGRMGLQRADEAAAATALALTQEHVLLEELRHRSKNDLQLILTMLIVQKRRQSDEQVRLGFDDVMDRIAAIGMAHDQLTPGLGAGRVDLADYLQALCGNLSKRREEVRFEVQLAHIEIRHEHAVPLGLIVNELVTNALKYAFPTGRSGTIRVDLTVLSHGEGCLNVRDDGIGMGAPRPGSSGTDLLHRLVQQIGGDLSREEVQSGTAFAISFPVVA